MTQRQRIVITQHQRLALNASLHASIRLLRGDTAGLTRYLEEQVAENPHLRLVPPAAPVLGDWLPRWSGVIQPGSATQGDMLREQEAAAPSLVAHVMAAIFPLRLDAQARHIALALTEALEPSGWLGCGLNDIATGLGLDVRLIEPVLEKLQSIDPPGIFARNLAECLRLQAQDAGLLDRPMAIILENLGLLAAGDTARLARLCACSEADVLARFRHIRAMNPKPGSTFSPGAPATLREPDLLARPLKNGRWAVSLNRSVLPDVEVLATPPEPETADAAHLAAARSLQFALKARNRTLLKVGQEIARRQVAALIQGPGALLPMTMAGVASSVDLHESTISRVVAGASLDSPRGMWWLRQMFSGARGGSRSQGDDAPPAMAAAALRHRISQLIAAEPPEFPLSDKALSERLGAETGITLARRTVTKYRIAMAIPAAHRRRRTKSLPKAR